MLHAGCGVGMSSTAAVAWYTSAAGVVNGDGGSAGAPGRSSPCWPRLASGSDLGSAIKAPNGGTTSGDRDRASTRSTRCSSEERRYAPPRGVRRAGERRGGRPYDEDFEAFWERQGHERLKLVRALRRVRRLGAAVQAQWYLGGKLNVCFNGRRPPCRRRVAMSPSRITGRAQPAQPDGSVEPAGPSRTPTSSGTLSASPTCSSGPAWGKGTPVAIYMAWSRSCRWRCSRARASRRAYTVVFGGFSAHLLPGSAQRGDAAIKSNHAARRRGGAARPCPSKGRPTRRMAHAPGVRASVVLRRTATTCPCRRAPRTWHAARGRRVPRPRPRARASRWTARTCCSSCTRAARPRSQGDRAHDRRLSRRRRRDAPTSST